MGYDVHIVKTNHWLDAKNDPVTKQEVEILVEKDSELTWSQKDHADFTDENGVVVSNFAIIWKNNPCFWWYKDQIMCSHARKEQVIKMVQMSKIIGARVVGDDGERYDVKKNIWGQLNLLIHKIL
jgi:hypothetical protein